MELKQFSPGFLVSITVTATVLSISYVFLPQDITCNYSNGSQLHLLASPAAVGYSTSIQERSVLRSEESIELGDLKEQADIYNLGQVLGDEDLRKEAAQAGLDPSAQEILSQILKGLKYDAATLAPTAANHDKVADKKLFNFNYGVARVVRRLVVCSAYRTSFRDFTIIALSPDFTVPTSNPDFKNLPPKDPAVYRTCTWVGDGNAGAPRFRSVEALVETGRAVEQNGVVDFTWINENHETTYDTVLIHCSFPKSVGLDSAGGFLYLNITHGPHSSPPAELAPVLRERSAKNAALRNIDYHSFYKPNRTNFQYEFAYCSAPSFTDLADNHLKQFLMYHHSLLGGNVHFFIYYSREIDEETMTMVLTPLVEKGVVTLVDFSKESGYDIWYHGQGLAINDCLYRARFLAKWALFWDLDEYLHIQPPLTLPALLQRYQESSWISFGKIEFSIAHCSPRPAYSTSTTQLSSIADHEESWAVERMLFRSKGPICGELCHGPMGSRKWMCNPRKVKSGNIHSVGRESVRGGVALSTQYARINHYRGLAAPHGRFNCEHIILDDSDSIPGEGRNDRLWRDESLATLVKTSLKNSAEVNNTFRNSGS